MVMMPNTFNAISFCIPKRKAGLLLSRQNSFLLWQQVFIWSESRALFSCECLDVDFGSIADPSINLSGG